MMSLFISMFFYLNPKPSSALNFLHEFLESCVCGDLISSSPGDHESVLESVLDGPEPVPESVLGLHERVLVGALRQDGHGLLVGAVLHERVFVLAQHMLVR